VEDIPELGQVAVGAHFVCDVKDEARPPLVREALHQVTFRR